ncbi:uncharacterized protein LOC125531408 [Triticum urartu]|uniref:uncharacterized protein LOC125531408 n=1 Tax=Triticum urartu TaxID=4572 RepID=UPI002044068D|nr:uncharacterized protein LOC125531408 [Triticum urartu]
MESAAGTDLGKILGVFYQAEDGEQSDASSLCSPPPSPCSTPCKVHRLVGDHGSVCFFCCCVVDDDDAAVRSVPSDAVRRDGSHQEGEEEQGEHQQQDAAGDEERQVHARLQDRSQDAAQLQGSSRPIFLECEALKPSVKL